MAERVARAAAGALGALLGAALLAAPATAASTFKKVRDMTVPDHPIASFDLTTIDPETRTYYFTDRSNAGIDIFDTKSYTFSARVTGFSGPTGSLDTAGPNGVVLVPRYHQLWAGNGDSTVKVIDLSADPPAIVTSIPTGGKKRADSIAYDLPDDIVAVVNDADDPPFVTFIAAGGGHKILGRIAFPDATNGLEAPIHVEDTGLFYLSVPQIGPDKAKGGIAVIDPKTFKVLRTIPLRECQPAGLVQGPETDVLVGCSADAVAAGFKPKTVIIDARTEKEVATITQIGGSDEVAYASTTELYFLAARGMTGGPQLGIINATTRAWVMNVPTANNSHAVAADPITRRVFVPEAANDGCPQGCIAVFARRRE